MTDTSTSFSPAGPGDAARANLARTPGERSSRVAAMVGAGFGAVAFALCVLWIGALAGLVIALVSTLHALWRRRARAAIAFVVAGALSAAATQPSATFALLGALAYGGGLAVTALDRRRSELLA